MCTNVCWCVLMCADVHKCVLMCNVYWCLLMCTDVHKYVVMCTNVHKCVLMCTNVHKCVLMCMNVYWCVLMCTDVYWCVQWCTAIFPMHKSNCNETRKDTENTIIIETRKYTETFQNICSQTRWNMESPRWIHNTETHGNIYLEENETRETRKEYKIMKTRQDTERNKPQPSITRFGTNSWNIFETRKAQTRHGTCLIYVNKYK